MKWINNNIITDESIEKIENQLGIKFPTDFVSKIKEVDGGYPIPNKITIDNQIEVLNNMVSFLEDNPSFILDIIQETETFPSLNLIPIAEDPFGNLYCYYFGNGKCEIVFWDHEDINIKKNICNSFDELIAMLHE